ncbi:hypothetical protein [Sphaerotilus sp.]|uniref:hypothetical protein n=1 Tax=Sphaerotilus sp. TaxID=2093942 RepID=UPI0034E1C4D8
MQHFLVILLGLHLGIGLLLLNVGPLSDLMRETRQDALNSRLILAVVLLLLWPCLWPTAVYRPQFGLNALTFEIHSRLDRIDIDKWSASGEALASAGWASGTSPSDTAR